MVNSSVQLPAPSSVRSFRLRPRHTDWLMVRIELAQPVSTTFLTRAAASTAASEKTEEKKKKSHYVERTFEARKQGAKIDPLLGTHSGASRLDAAISRRSGQVGRAGFYVLADKELEVRFILANLRVH